MPSHLFLRNFFRKLLTKPYLYDILVKQFTLQYSDGRIMFEKNMKIAYLLDFYGDALDDHVSTVMRAYYNEDLSLAEIEKRYTPRIASRLIGNYTARKFFGRDIRQRKAMNKV